MNKTGFLSTRRRKDMAAGYLLVLPAVLYLVVFLIGPILFAFNLSFQNYNLLKPQAAEYIGLSNYISLFQDPVFVKALRNTFVFSFFVVPIQTALALLLAVVANQKIRGKTFFRVSYYLPSITSAVAVATIFLFLFNRFGVVNTVLGAFGADPINWVSSPDHALTIVIVMTIWSSIGANMLIFLAGLQDIPGTVYEAARVDGASGLQQFYYLTVPLLREKTFFVLIIGLIGSLQVFDQSYIISKGTGGPINSTMTVVLYLYNKAFKENLMGYASAAAFVLFLLIFVLTLVQKRFFDTDSSR